MNELYEQKLRRTRMLWITAIVTGIIVILGVAGFFLMRYQREKTYSRYINEADQYFVSKQYDEAITSYKKAIKIDKSRYRPYEGAGQSYIEMERYSEARVFLQEGIDNTGSQELEVLYNRIKDAKDYTSLNTMEAHPEQEEPLIVDNTMVMNIGSYTYKQYTGTYGEGTVSMENGTCVIRYDKLNAKAYYEKPAAGLNLNPVTGRPYDGQVPTYLVFNDLSKIFPQWDGRVKYASLQKLVDGFAEINKNSNNYTIVFPYMNSRFEIACDPEGNINEVDAENKVYPMAASTSENMGTVFGTIVDSKTGAALEEVTVRAVDGTDSETGNVIQEALSDNNGEFQMQLPAGDYTIEYAKEGYQTSVVDGLINISTGTNESLPQKALVPELDMGDWTIVMTWNGKPEPVDMHVVTDDGIEASIDTEGNEVKGSKGDGVTLVSEGVGKQTATITNMQQDVSYTIYVHEYSYDEGDDSMLLAHSDAKVTLTNSSGETWTFSVPKEKGTLWNVATILNGEVSENRSVGNSY